MQNNMNTWAVAECFRLKLIGNWGNETPDRKLWLTDLANQLNN